MEYFFLQDGISLITLDKGTKPNGVNFHISKSGFSFSTWINDIDALELAERIYKITQQDEENPNQQPLEFVEEMAA